MDEAGMRERIARALAEDIDRTMPRFVQQKWDDLTDLAKAAMFRRADAVLEAMMVPTPEMLRAVDGEDADKMVARGRAYSAWQSMITAARSGSSGER